MEEKSLIVENVLDKGKLMACGDFIVEVKILAC